MIATAAMPSARPAATPGSTAENASASTNAACCESVAPRWPSRRSSAHVAAQGTGGEAGEGEQEHGRRAADEQDATRCGAPGGARLGERIVRRREAELAVGGGQRGLRAALPASRRSMSQTWALLGSRAAVQP